MHKFSTHKDGFTLIEILVAMGILSFIGLAIVAFQVSVLRGTASMQAGLITQQQVRKTFSQFTQEVRTAVPAPSGASALLEVGTSTLSFYSNIDKDALIERVKYFLGTSTVASTTEFYRQVIKPAGGLYLNANQQITIMVKDIRFSTSTAIFSYYDANYAGTSTPLVQPVTTTAVRLIKIALPVDPNAARSPIFQTYSTQVSLRNLKDNL